MEPRILPPTLRTQKRYVVFDVIADTPVQYIDLVSSIQVAALDFLGELGTAEAGMWVIKNLYDEQKMRGIIRCAHTSVEQVRAALALVTMIGETPAVMTVRGVTGTIESAKQKYGS